MGRIIGIISVVLTLSVLASCTDKRAMRERLDYVSQCNRADTVFTEAWLPTVDSLVNYFDRHGNANEKMMAHYLKGRVHHDMGESPIALECYQQAAEMADTTRIDCALRTLASVFSQSASLYKKAGLYQQEISHAIKASQTYLLAGDTLRSILCYELTFSPYYHLNKIDSAVNVLLKTREMYINKGLRERAALAISGLVYIFLKDSLQLTKAKHYMNVYENESGLFDKFGNLPPHQYQYYGYKGLYYKRIGKNDSAEYYFRKALEGEKSLSTSVICYHGLLDVFKERNNIDSMKKYSELYCKYNDSTLLNRNTEEMGRMAALYDYSRHQNIAAQKTIQATRVTIRLWVIISLFVLFVVLGALFFYFYKKRKQAIIDNAMFEYLKTKELYDKKKEELSFYQQSIGELIQAKQDTIDRLKGNYTTKAIEYEKLKNKTEQFKEEQLKYIQTKNMEIEELQNQISILCSQKDLSPLFAKYDELLSIPIIGKFHLCGESLKGEIIQTDWDKLKNEIKSRYPKFTRSLEKVCSGNSQTEHAGLLMFLQFRTDEIANILKTSKQRVTNIKIHLNTFMFGDNSARTFYANMKALYNFK